MLSLTCSMNFWVRNLIFFENFYTFRKEMEVDYTGLLLIASAGYDPRNAPTVCERLGKISGESHLSDYLCTHPSGKKWVELVAQAKVMEEAVTAYREVRPYRTWGWKWKRPIRLLKLPLETQSELILISKRKVSLIYCINIKAWSSYWLFGR